MGTQKQMTWDEVVAAWVETKEKLAAKDAELEKHKAFVAAFDYALTDERLEQPMAFVPYYITKARAALEEE